MKIYTFFKFLWKYTVHANISFGRLMLILFESNVGQSQDFGDSGPKRQNYTILKNIYIQTASLSLTSTNG